MKINKKNYKRVLENITKQIEESDDNDQQCWFESLNDLLDEMLDHDFFGTEGQNDPRGDRRN